ncbi:YceI family protein [Dyadobacter chenwenxiniae]|uniref:YceI family protein n=1 Tax=Dyadobacter chenwenxiniae TaxID=2906456 RepID=A0A9X1TGA3_9BACT|nr:YceI family protein [Dyadobacter chenwenxiniae]MCF0063474.1 YceI family protein [Dyadobacter chenwenxiniae]UON85147.1 YceI family protein [Dyadobacter chenwenxiniae]
MFRKYKLLALIAISILSSFTFLFIADWEISKGYTIHFDGKYAKGSFSDLSGLITFDPENPGAAAFDVSVKVASIETGNDLKNKHAKSDKWFDAEHFPEIRFTSSKVTRIDSAYMVIGMLELRGIKKEIAIPFTFRPEGGGSHFYGKFKVNRGDFGIGKTNGKDSDSTLVEVSVPVMSKN